MDISKTKAFILDWLRSKVSPTTEPKTYPTGVYLMPFVCHEGGTDVIHEIALSSESGTGYTETCLDATLRRPGFRFFLVQPEAVAWAKTNRVKIAQFRTSSRYTSPFPSTNPHK